MQPPVLEKFSALDKALEATCEMLQHIVHTSPFIQQGPCQPQQEFALLRLELSRKGATGHFLQPLSQRRSPLAICQYPPERLEGSARITFTNDINPGKQLLLHITSAPSDLPHAMQKTSLQPLQTTTTQKP